MTIISIANVCTFDGRIRGGPAAVTFVASPGSIVSSQSEPEVIIDGSNCTLLPGFIDSKMDDDSWGSSLSLFTAAGITTVIDASSGSAKANAMRAMTTRGAGLPNYLSTGTAIGAQGHDQSVRFPLYGFESVNTPAEVERCVLSRITGAAAMDFVKVIVDQPGLSLDALTLAVETAHKHDKIIIGHASQVNAYRLAMTAGFDIVTPVPLDGPLDNDIIEGFLAKGIAVIPTLFSVMQELRHVDPRDDDLSNAMNAVRALHRAGIQICAGTAANHQGRTSTTFGGNLHQELRMLVESGMSNAQALRSVTYVPAKVFRLQDRGMLKLGSRADMVLVHGNPLDDLEATTRIRRVWIGGVLVINNDREL